MLNMLIQSPMSVSHYILKSLKTKPKQKQRENKPQNKKQRRVQWHSQGFPRVVEGSLT